MVHRHISIAESYSVLGLSEGATIEVVRSTYKQLALKTHPDKNPGDANATVQFQRIGEAYNALLKHLDKSNPPPRPSRAYNPFTGPVYGSEDEYDDYDYSDDEFDYYDDYDSEDDYYEEERMDFFMFLFEEMMRGRGSRFSQARFHHECDCPIHRQQREERPKETEAQYQARVRRSREEQENAQERRKQEAAHKKAQQEEERVKERRAAEKRQKEKASKKKAQAETSRKAAEDKVRAQRQQSQKLRSAVFAAARNGDAAAVKKGVWQDSVDAAGGEALKGCEDLVNSLTKDKSETLSHIAAGQNDLDLFEWLDTQGADQGDRDSRGYTPFHAALADGNIPIIEYILENHPPEDVESPYQRSSSNSNLQLAVDTRMPETVLLVLKNNLYSKEELADVWTQLNSKSGRQAFLNTPGPGQADDKLARIIDLLVSYGKFERAEVEEDEHASTTYSETESSSDDDELPQPLPSAAKGKPYRGRGRGKPPPPQSRPFAPPFPAADAPLPGSPQSSVPPNSHGSGPRGRGRGRGRGGRGRGGFRGRGGGSVPTSKP